MTRRTCFSRNSFPRWTGEPRSSGGGGWPAHLGSKGGEATVLGRWRGGLSTLPAEAARPLAPITSELAETTGSHRLPRGLHGLDMAHSSVDHSVHCLDTKPPVGG